MDTDILQHLFTSQFVDINISMMQSRHEMNSRISLGCVGSVMFNP